MEEEFNPYSFMPTDIVVWNKIIAKHGAIIHFTQEGDELHIANEEEKLLYQNTSTS